MPRGLCLSKVAIFCSPRGMTTAILIDEGLGLNISTARSAVPLGRVSRCGPLLFK